MKILTIGLYGLPSGTSSDLISANVFEDYDALVVNPDDLSTLYGDYTGRHFARSVANDLDKDFARFAANLNGKRHQQVRGLLQKDGVIICFLQPYRSWADVDKTHFISNYSWLLESGEIHEQFGNLINGTGTTISYIDSSHPFTEYLSLKPPWEAYIQHDKYDQMKWKVLASAFGTHILSIASTSPTGHIIFLPSSYDVENGELLEQCIIKLLADKHITPIPEWAKSIIVPGQHETLKALEEVDTQISALGETRNTLISKNYTLESWKWLLYETGKHRLEPIVHSALSLLGCQVEPQPDSDSDGKVETEFGTALLEIEGAQETVKIDKVSQLLRNIANFVSREDMPVKGILVGNPFRFEEPSNRPPKGSQKKLFSDAVIRTSSLNNISVLLTTELYQIVCRILDKQLNARQLKSLRKRIFQEKGPVSLSIP
jgi:hypothetical protein